MSEMMSLSDLLGATQNNSTMETTDRVLVTTNENVLKRVKKETLCGINYFAEVNISDNTRRWYTIARMAAGTAWGGLLITQDGNWAGTPKTMIFAIGGRYDSTGAQKPRVNSLLGLDSYVKLRAVVEGNQIRLDIYLSTKHITNLAVGDLPLITPVIAEDVPSGATSWVWDFSSNVYGT